MEWNLTQQTQRKPNCPEQSHAFILKGAVGLLAAPAGTNTYLTYLNVGVLYGVGVTFDQLLHLPQVGLLDLLELLLGRTRNTQHGDTRESHATMETTPNLPSLHVCVFL